LPAHNYRLPSPFFPQKDLPSLANLARILVPVRLRLYQALVPTKE
jgi:hypothetical protein